MAPRRQSLRPSRMRTRPVLNYAESSSASSSEGCSSTESEQESAPPKTRSSRNTSKPLPTTKKRPRPISSHSQPATEGFPTPKKQNSRAPLTKSADNVAFISSKTIPPWHTLPYGILLQIFRYASYPVYNDQTFQSLPSSRWLLDMATLCPSFSEPALTALYTSPPLVPMVQAHRLVDLLTADPRSMAFKYRQKVESLRIEVSLVAAYSLPGSGLLDLHGLVKDLPRLTELEFYHQKDMSPYRNLEDNIKWTYPENVFDALEYVDPTADSDQGDKTSVCRLRSWRWSSRLAGKKWPIEKIPQIHLKPFFASLQKLAIVNYQAPVLKKDQADPKHEEIMATALGNLKNLEHLVFESSTLLNHKLLPLLPRNLRHVELINCWEVTADDFGAFLLTHGYYLRCLTLHHNQSLSLSFLPLLGNACPNLEVLRMNLTYFNIHPTYRNSEPLYDELLLPEEVPVWPSKLQIIELTQMRKWQTNAAEVFFQSLLDSAGQLSDLRRLSIQAILNIGWRDRASFRDNWVGSLARVFKRVSNPPKHNPTIMRPSTSGEKISDATKNGDLIDLITGMGEVEKREFPRRKTLRSSSISIPSDLVSTSQASPSPASETRGSRSGHNAHNSASTFDQTVVQSQSPPEQCPSRKSTRQQPRVIYVESDDEPEITSVSTLNFSRPKATSRELKRLQDSAGFHGSFATPPETPEDTSTTSAEDGVSENGKGKGKTKEIIQGMCDVVEIRIDNLRPAENQVTEADFLDEEQSGDEDWNGDNDADDGYAW